MKIREAFGVASNVCKPDFTVGIECEVEDLIPMHGSASGYWHKTEDGSLRNNGLEYVSAPMDKTLAKIQFDVLHNWLRYDSEDVRKRFSERTSIHVHVNCLELETTQVRSIILWYALFEPLFFKMVAIERANNIHCVSLNQTHLSKHYTRPLQTMKQVWSKYTALNILPLSQYGTLEFRHMQGTDNQELFDEWLDTINNLWEFGKNNTITKELIMNPETIVESFKAIFKDSPQILKYQDQVPSLIEGSLIDIKLSLLKGNT